MKLVALILTFNEELHLARCLASLEAVVDSVLVVDCFSTDSTVEIARSYGANVLQNEWLNYATQFNWALTKVAEDTDWVLRIDADEYLTTELAEEIRRDLPSVTKEVGGIFVGRSMKFQGKLIRHGGLFPIRVARLFRLGCGECENRWMDEHIKVAGRTVDFQGELIDDNLNSVTWWTEKHNRYASREAVDLLNLTHSFIARDSVASLSSGGQASFKRWLKEHVYSRLPGGLRAFSYFIYRYVARLGFLDGREGTAFHVLQGFWYRYLVDVKVAEVERYMSENDCHVIEAIDKVLEIKLDAPAKP